MTYTIDRFFNFVICVGNPVCLRGVADGRLLGVRVLSHGGDIPASDSAFPGSRDTQYTGNLYLLHERHHNGVYRRIDTRRRDRAL